MDKWEDVIVTIIVRHKERNLAAAVELEKFVSNYEIKLTPGVIVSGKVVDVEDKGISDTEISLIFSDPMNKYYYQEIKNIDADGNFEIRAVPPGYEHHLIVKAEGYGKQSKTIHSSEALDDHIKLEPFILAVANLSVSGIVLDVFDKAVPNATVSLHGRGQPSRETLTDLQGNFTIDKVCAGSLKIQAQTNSQERMYGQTESNGGATDIKIVLMPLDANGMPQPPSLLGKSLSKLNNIKLDFNPEQAKNKMILLCFFNMQQRPSRNCMKELAKQAGELKEKNIVVVAIQASKVDEKTLNNWIKENNIPFPIGMVRDDEEKIRITWGVKLLPWLILTDKQHIVYAEGFALEELDEKIKDSK